MEQIPQEEPGVRFKKSVNRPRKLVVVIYELIVKFISSTSGVLGRLTLAQKLYLLSLILLVLPDNLGLVAIITVIALTLEFWPLFVRVWHSLSGKAVLLLFYAIIANFAIAGAASVVNEVVGVATTHFSYTHNFAILLYLPAWVIAMTALAILMLQVAVPFYLIGLLLLKPFGVKGLKLINHSHFRFTTMFIRLILASVVLYHLILIASLNNELSDDLNDPDGIVLNKLSESDKQELATELDRANKDLEAQEATSDKPTIGLSFGSDEINKEKEELYRDVRSDYEKLVRTLIARFAYQLESDSRSRCEISPGSNVVELNDYEIVEIRKDNTADYGFTFEVKKCISPAFPAVSG
ncbi:conserved hypothetical protein [Shewanella sediminis HAW-EB3]|uniref:Uncharacterized protein n=1 Tax=Shewanella sediminis (strain HAW-EB3) TaxID=425104 RepID=A8FVH4_SHESH|nr:hypothetical protein [Shewanella sediminis]ABV36847.1 conserved hypothetical protein [Shewanella sediminis HAW-EB3]